MKYLYCIIFLLFFVGVTISQNNTITVLEKDGAFFLQKNDKELQGTFKGSGDIKKQAFLEMVKDVPELHSYAYKNLNIKRVSFAWGLINCYNDYMSTGKSKELNEGYFRSFGLIPLSEYTGGPRDEDLLEKKRIIAEITKISVTSTNYVNGMPSGGGTYGENFRAKFSYGNAQYKTGFLLSNLKKAVANDKEALRYVRKYRANWTARTSMQLIGVGLLITNIRMLNGAEVFGFNEEAFPAAALPTVFFFNWPLIFPQKYKAKNIGDAVKTYNQNINY